MALWAAVDANGRLVRGSHVVSVTLPGQGVERVTFDQDVSGCVFTESANSDSLTSTPPTISAAPTNGDTTSIDIETNPSIQPFHLIVAC